LIEVNKTSAASITFGNSPAPRLRVYTGWLRAVNHEGFVHSVTLMCSVIIFHSY